MLGENQILEFNGAKMFGTPDDWKIFDEIFQIVSLTDNELFLYLSVNTSGTGRKWIFRPE